MPPWKKRLVAVMYGEMARKPPQVPDPEAICWLEGGESPVSQTKNGLTVNPEPGWSVRRAVRSHPSAGTSTVAAVPPLAEVVPTVPKAAPAVKRTSLREESSSRPETPAQPRLVLPPGAVLSRTASRRE